MVKRIIVTVETELPVGKQKYVEDDLKKFLEDCNMSFVTDTK